MNRDRLESILNVLQGDVLTGEAKKSILLIDDDPIVLKSLSKLLEKNGYLVQAFQDPREAVEQALIEDFDLVVTDVRMPHIDGVQAIRYIREVRSQKAMPAIPEVVITGYAKEEAVEELNVAGFLHKPFDQKEFLEVIAEALSKGDN